MLALVRVNELPSCYIRPIAMRAYGESGVNPLKNPVDVYLACWEWGKYLGEEALAEGVDVCVSSWNRLAANTLPTLAKAGANYMNRSEEHTSELQSLAYLVCRLLLEKKKKTI